MRVLLRVAVALLLAVPLLLVVVMLFLLAGRRGASVPLESAVSPSSARGAAVGSALHPGEGLLGVSH
jgi:hypothetical protein